MFIVTWPVAGIASFLANKLPFLRICKFWDLILKICGHFQLKTQASFLGCDVLMNPERIPPLVKDYYWDKQDCPIPYTEAAMKFKVKTYKGSADEMKWVIKSLPSNRYQEGVAHQLKAS